MTAEECVKEIMKIQERKEIEKEINKEKEMIKYLSWKKRR